MKAKTLIEKYGIRGALQHLNEQRPSFHLKKELWTDEQKQIVNVMHEIKEQCKHEDTRMECIDYHRRDFGTICNDCGSILDSNG